MRSGSTIAIARRALLAAALVAALVSAGCAHLLPSGVIEPAIVPSLSQRGTRTVQREFAFENGKVRLEVPIDTAVYAGAVSAPKSAIFIGDKTPADWIPDYYRAFIAESHQEAFYAALLSALHSVRQREGLDASRYVELVTSMVQQIEYKTDPVNLAPKFPIETFGDGYGDCDDKTLLAAALLSRDGYDVAVLVFTPEKHVAMGIRAPGLDYKGTGYAYVELTEPSIVGIPAEKLSGGVSLTSQPEVIRIGEGTLAFAAGAQVTYIQTRLAAVRATEKQLNARIASEKAALAADQAALAAEKLQVDSATDPQARAAAVRSYNHLVGQYNAHAAAVNAFVAEFNRLVDAERFVAGHQNARPQVYERLQSLKL